jgi:hypothetical protein
MDTKELELEKAYQELVSLVESETDRKLEEANARVRRINLLIALSIVQVVCYAVAAVCFLM